MFRSLLVMAFIFASSVALLYNPPAQQGDEITSTPITSLFEADTCTPPCWFGLLPGVSTANDVVVVLVSNSENWHSTKDFAAGYHDFETDTEIPDDGFYKFAWETYPKGAYLLYSSQLTIRDNVLAWMRITAPKFISIDDVIAHLGYPEDVRVFSSTITYELTLFYPSINIIVELTADRANCSIAQIAHDFPVNYVYYYPANTRESVEEEFYLDYRSSVPESVWQMWFVGTPASSCEDEFRRVLSMLPVGLTGDTPTPSPDSSKP